MKTSEDKSSEVPQYGFSGEKGNKYEMCIINRIIA